MNEYKHTQIGYSLLNSYTIVFLVIGVINFVTEFAPLALLALIIILLTISTFATLTVTVNQQELRIRFGIDIIRKSFELGDIARYQEVKPPGIIFLAFVIRRGAGYSLFLATQPSSWR